MELGADVIKADPTDDVSQYHKGKESETKETETETETETERQR